MYGKFYREASEVADLIRSGEWNKRAGAKEKPRPSGFMAPRKQEDEAQETSELEFIASMIAKIRSINDEIELDMEHVEQTPRPRSYEDGGRERPLSGEALSLTDDPAFMENLAYFQEKHGVSDTELFNIIRGESAFNPKAQNKDTNAAGLFQFIPSTASELGYTPEEILDMEPAEQLMVYDQYLDRWGYQGEGLGIMQAAPAYRDAGDDDVIYDVGSAAWDVNPGWRAGGDGPITKASINNYYRRERK